MASARARWVLLLLLALASAHVASAAWGKKAEPAAAKVKEEAAKPVAAAAVATVADANAGLSHADETGVNTYWYNEVTGEVSSRDPSIEFRGFDSASGHKYWIDPATGASSWERPAAYAWKEEPSAEHAGHSYFYNTVTKESTWVRPAILGWKAAEKGFWHNNVTGESTWKQPDALGIPSPDGGRPYWLIDGAPTWTPPAEYAWRAVPSTEESHAGRVYFENWRTKETTWDRPAALGWSRRSYNNTYYWNVVTGETSRSAPGHVVGFEAPSGHKYYLDPETQQPTWEAPAQAAWKEGHSEEHDRAYFYNHVTNERTWTRPGDSNLAWVRFHEEL